MTGQVSAFIQKEKSDYETTLGSDVRGCSLKQVFLKNSQISQESHCVGISF